jgi:hypothetical protein
MNQSDAWRMIRRRAVAAGIHAPIGYPPPHGIFMAEQTGFEPEHALYMHRF